jgi:DNA-binding CsgD family transcriptional regulator
MFSTTLYYTTFALISHHPQNIQYKLSICLRSGSKILGLIGIFRPREHQDFSERDAAKARIMAPHLTTALENVMQLQELASCALGITGHQLTKREIDVVRCVCQGLTNTEIGKRLYISRFTVETHVKNIFDKTGVKHRAGLASLLQLFEAASGTKHLTPNTSLR